MDKLKSVKTKQGNEICLLGNSPHGKTLVIGVFHGDEPQGKFLIEEYIKKIDNSFPPNKKCQKCINIDNSLDYPPLAECHNCLNDDKISNYPPLAGGSKSLISGRGIANHKYTIKAKINAKILRNNLQKPEIILWKYLSNKQILNKKFRRQQPIGNFVVDFMCCNPKIIIELDGAQHNETSNIQYDKKRDIYLKEQGFKILRIWNNEICNNIEGVIEFIKNEIINPSPKSEISTLPQGEGKQEYCPYRKIYTTPQGEGCLANPLHQDDFDTAQGIGNLWTFSHQDNFGTTHEAGCQMLCQHNNLLFIPCLNPDGMHAGTRTNSNGVDLNRNFPTKNWVLGERTITGTGEKNLFFGGNEPASEIETQFLIDTIEEYKPETILTLHAPYKVVNYDGPAKELAQMISDIMNYPVEESIGYPTPGSFGTYAGIERNIKTITLELDEICPVEKLISPVHRVFDKL